MNVDIKARHVRSENIVGIMPYGWRCANKDWACDVWSVTLTYQGRSYTTEYRTGIGHRRQVKEFYRGHETVKISAQEVLACLFSDGAIDTFEDWCGDCGYDTDSRKALALYLECQRVGIALRRLFGADYAQAEEWCRDA
jgi:hypothetical protein